MLDLFWLDLMEIVVGKVVVRTILDVPELKVNLVTTLETATQLDEPE